MDYQTFNGQQHHLPSSLGGFSTPLPGTSTPAHAHTPQQQQQHFYGDPHARFQQQQQQTSQQNANLLQYNGQAGGFQSMGGGNAMMQPGNLSQHQLHHARGKWITYLSLRLPITTWSMSLSPEQVSRIPETSCRWPAITDHFASNHRG